MLLFLFSFYLFLFFLMPVISFLLSLMEKQAKEINFSSLRPPLFHKTVNVV